jgi:hypothetical protein
MAAQEASSRQVRLQRFILLFGVAAAFPAAGADIVFYESDGFRGRSFVANQTISNFANVGFNDRASSVVIRSGTWQLCSDAFFRGRCVTLAPGEYPNLRSMALENQISSARELEWLGGGGGAARPGGRVELFSGNRFEGRVFVVNEGVTNLPNDFNDQAQSMIVYDGYWEVCADIDFRGACQNYGPGRHASLGGLSNRVSSLRPAAGPGPGSPPGPGPGPAGSVDLFEGIQFTGAGFGVDAPTPGLPREFNDRAQSMIVYDGYWEICADIDYRGGCQTYGPGRHANLGALSGRVSSMRPVPGPGPGPFPDGGGWGTGARALLYEGPNLSGRTYAINAEVMPNLDGARFNDRASSLRIEGGYWLFCSDINFGGECLTFGPGDYPTLPWSLNNKISSGRRIREQYPYNQSPNWPR